MKQRVSRAAVLIAQSAGAGAVEGRDVVPGWHAPAKQACGVVDGPSQRRREGVLSRWLTRLVEGEEQMTVLCVPVSYCGPLFTKRNPSS